MGINIDIWIATEELRYYAVFEGVNGESGEESGYGAYVTRLQQKWKRHIVGRAHVPESEWRDVPTVTEKP